MSLVPKRVVVTGMAVNTPLSDSLTGYLDALLAGQSAISKWKSFDASRIYSKIGGDLGDYNIKSRLAALADSGVPLDYIERSRKIIAKAPWSVSLSVLLALDAWRDASLFGSDIDADRVCAIVGGQNIQNRYRVANQQTFEEEPDYIDALYAIHSHDTTHIGCVSDALRLRGSGMLVGAACATGAYALRAAVDEIRWHDAPAAVVVGAVWDFAPMDMHAMALIGAISQDSFNDCPEKASRPFDRRREGFVPAHGGGAIVIEEASHAERRGAQIYAEVLGVETCIDGSYLPTPSEEGEVRAMTRVLEACGVSPSQIDYINGHFTSTPLGDIAEIRAVKRVFADHANQLKLNATKSMTGHTMSGSAIVELIGAILQMRASRLHPTINVDEPDSEIDLDVCANSSVTWPVQHFLKNTFGFGGLNASILVRNTAV
ncbi:beta-ketoacyl-[acyl-carrier-protein] synthase family protein [Methylobacterium sp. Leaf87]|uniref:beta-ketoacyl-[acyl-carrier-protein] synthase family protein n=1 Tax=Methylobacterium sp. Leaf87 TaxID=1736243 RepID=UPI0009EC2F4A|nr:beta-ketoacyl-[acyl-carrier-protein] synthase family protein [Methylobacterium sp. Leaf87]